MFSIQNNDPKKIVFVFSDGLQNDLGMGLARSFLRKGEVDLELDDLELMPRRSIFQSLPRKRMTKLCLRMFKVIKKLTNSEIRDYV